MLALMGVVSCKKLKYKLKQLCSGGQLGADLGGLEAAMRHDLPTSGTMPHNFINHSGSHPEYAELYNIKEHQSSQYPPRTECNVKDSDGTIRFAINFDSPGEKCTLKFIKKHNKPYLDININFMPKVEEVKKWLIDNNVEILNVAGNSEKRCPGIQRIVKNYIEI